MKVIAYDLGTGGVKASLYNEKMETLAKSFVEYSTNYVGRLHEQNIEDWWNGVATSTRKLLADSSTSADEVQAVALSGHSLVSIPLDTNNSPLEMHVPIWSDGRAVDETQEFFKSIPYEEWYMTTGNGFPPECYPVFKLMWLKKHKREIYDKTCKVAGSKDYINLLLTGNLCTDYSYASGSGVYDLRKQMYRILLVEDDWEINKLLAGFLTENGYQVRSLYNGLHAADFLSREPTDLVLLDLMLPYRSGDLVLADIRKQYTLPVIIVSAKETTQNKIDLLRLGADDYITKPFDMEEVLARIESCLRRVQFQTAAPKRLQYNNLVWDGDKNTVFLNNQEVPLTAKELAILELLMRYPDKVFSKANLFQSIWDAEYLSEDNTLHVHISNLRNKLKAVSPEEEYIDTVWGIGYRLHKAGD